MTPRLSTSDSPLQTFISAAESAAHRPDETVILAGPCADCGISVPDATFARVKTSAPVSQSAFTDEPRWFAVHCQPHRERGAAAHLANQEFEVFLPCREKTRRHARKIETVRVPFFPGYLFIKLNMTRDRWRSVNGTFGVVRLVMQGEQPAPAPVGVVEAFMAASDDNGVLSLRPELVLGRPVRVLVGPFANLVGKLERMTDSGRVQVLLDILGGRTPVFLPTASVERADNGDSGR